MYGYNPATLDVLHRVRIRRALVRWLNGHGIPVKDRRISTSDLFIDRFSVDLPAHLMVKLVRLIFTTNTPFTFDKDNPERMLSYDRWERILAAKKQGRAQYFDSYTIYIHPSFILENKP